MTMRHFDTDFFAEIINGMISTCDGLEVQQLLNAATKIYLAGADVVNSVREGNWIEENCGDKAYKPKKIVTCPFCSTKRAVFVGDTIDYCNGCGARLANK